jgi:hypothetical protein
MTISGYLNVGLPNMFIVVESSKSVPWASKPYCWREKKAWSAE